MIKTVGIFVNNAKEEAIRLSLILQSWLIDRGIEVFTTPALPTATAENKAKTAIKADILVALGGDGTLLEVARFVSGNSIPIVGINIGSLGYVTEVCASKMLSSMETILGGHYQVQRRMMLDVTCKDQSFVALNDAVIRSADARMVNIEARVNGEYLTTFRADGLIVCTPTGSTAYSLSTGGPIVVPYHNSLIINPICPHTLSNRPLIFPPEAVFSICSHARDKHSLLIVDGWEQLAVGENDNIVIKRSPHDTLLVTHSDVSYFEILRSKLAWSVPPNYRK